MPVQGQSRPVLRAASSSISSVNTSRQTRYEWIRSLSAIPPVTYSPNRRRKYNFPTRSTDAPVTKSTSHPILRLPSMRSGTKQSITRAILYQIGVRDRGRRITRAVKRYGGQMRMTKKENGRWGTKGGAVKRQKVVEERDGNQT